MLKQLGPAESRTRNSHSHTSAMAAAAEGSAKKMFSMNKVPKRQAVDAPSPGAVDASTARKLPKLSEMKLEAPRQPTQRAAPVNAPVNICVYKTTDASGDLWAAFPGTKIWQIQMDG